MNKLIGEGDIHEDRGRLVPFEFMKLSKGTTI